MTLQGEYVPSKAKWVRDQVEKYEATGGAEANTLRDTGYPIVVITSRGAKSGNLRKNPVMRVERDGIYVAIASKGGADSNPDWYYNLLANPRARIEVGTQTFDVTARTTSDEEREPIWSAQKADYTGFAGYEQKTTRQIPVVILEKTA